MHIKTLMHLPIPLIMMNSTMMTMATPISRTKRLIKMLERLLEKNHLYTDDQIILMREQLKVVRKELDDFKNKNSKGFK